MGDGMDFSLSDEQEVFKRNLREWCERKLFPRVKEIDEESKIPDEIIRDLANMGILGLTIPEEYGGSGLDFLTAALSVEEIARGDVSVATAVLVLLQQSWGYILSRYGSEELKEEVLPKVAKGEALVGIGSTEPQGGSDLLSFKSTARKEDDSWVLNGEKVYISLVREIEERGGGFLTIVKTSPELEHRGFSMIFVPLSIDGVETTLFKNMGRTGVSTGGFLMKEARVPLNYLIGEENKGFYIAMEGFNVARILVAAACVGAASKALEIGMDYIKQRKLFGYPIGKFEGIQFQLSDNYAKLEASRLLVYKAAWICNQWMDGKADIMELAKASATAKLYAPIECYRIADDVMTWMGAFGYSKESEIQACVRGLRSYSVGAEGAQNVMRIIIARELLGKEFLPYKK